MSVRVQLYLGRGEHDAGEVRDALAAALREWMTRSGELEEVEPRDHADVHVQIGPLGPLPWTLPWMAFDCEDVDGEAAVELARWVSQRTGAEVLAVVERGLTEVELLLFRAGDPATPPATPVISRPTRPEADDEDADDGDRDERSPGEMASDALGLRGGGYSALGGMMLLAFRRRDEVRFVDGPPALADLREVFADGVNLAPHQVRRLRMTATSVGGEGRGARVVAGGSAHGQQLVVVTRASWDSGDFLTKGSDDEAVFVNRDDVPATIAALPRARVPAARTDGVVAWTARDAARGDERRHHSTSIHVDVELVAGSDEGRGDLILRIDLPGAPAGGVVVIVPIVVEGPARH